MARLFAAVPITAPAVLAALESVGQAGRRERVRWLPANQLHVTLRFLGEVEEARIASVKEAVARATAGAASFPMALRGLGAFPRISQPRVVWVGFASGGVELSALAARLAAELAPVGFPPEDRPFSPHLTLGRAREGAGRSLPELIRSGESRDFGTSLASDVVLFQSVLSSSGAAHTPLLVCPLTPRA